MVLNTDVIEEFQNSSTIHGLSRFGGPELYSRRRLIWIFLVFSAATALVTFLVMEFIHLSTYPTSTIFTKILQNKIDFPAVTVCNLNQVKYTIAKCLTENEEDEIIRVFYAISEISPIMQHNETKSAITIPGDLLYSCALNYSHQLDDMLKYCYFKREFVPCSDIFTPKMTEYGICYTFNEKGGKVVEAVGEVDGLRFLVNIEQDQYFFASTIRAGIKVVLHDPSEEPLPSLRGFLVGPGLAASSSIKRSRVSTLPSPYGSCRQASDQQTGIGSYSELTCYKRCYDEFIIKKCGCRHFFLSGYVEYCNSDKLINCYARNHASLLKDTEFLQNCSCPPSCHVIKYETSLSYASFSSDFISNYLYSKGILPASNYTQKNFINLRLFYNTMMEEDTREVPEKSVGGILGTLGGLMGMFIGASLLSVVELIEFVCMLMTRGGQRVAANRRRKSDTLTDGLEVNEKTSKF